MFGVKGTHEETGSTTRPEPEVSKGLGRLRFSVAIEFSSKDPAVDHMVDLMTTGWPLGPKQERLKLIVINRELDEGHIIGVEVGTEQPSQLNQIMAKLAI